MKKSYWNPTVEIISLSVEEDMMNMSLEVVPAGAGDDWDLSQYS